MTKRRMDSSKQKGKHMADAVERLLGAGGSRACQQFCVQKGVV